MALRPDLYQRLNGRPRFGGVVIANEGVPLVSVVMRYGDRKGRDVAEWGEVYRVNCFAPETLVATPSGDVPIRDLVGWTRLLVPNGTGLGNWQTVEVRPFGKQKLRTVTLRRGRSVKTIRVTPDHRWVVAGNSQPVLTRDLAVGDRLASCYARVVAAYGKMRVSPVGVARGFVFGDGSCEKANRKPASVTVFTKSKLEGMRPYLDWCRSRDLCMDGRDISQRFADLPREWKILPPVDESLSVLLGWLAGYFAADGHVTKNGSAVLYSAKRSNLEFVKGLCYQLGIRVSPIVAKKRRSGGCVPDGVNNPMFGLSFSTRELPLEFWILPHHRERVESWLKNAGTKPVHSWIVQKVEDLGESSEVFCAVVPGVEKFSLADNLLTMNCPACYDTRHRLYINHRWGLKDEETGTRNWWLCHCFNEDCVSDFNAQMRLREMVYDDASPGADDAVLPARQVHRGPATLPGYCVPVADLPPHHRASRYLAGRGFAHLARPLDLQYCEWAYDREWMAERRLVIPMRMEGTLVTWQARFIDVDGPMPDKAPKYFTAPGTSKSVVLYNFNAARQVAGETVVVVEGPTDVWRYGPEAVATLGKAASMTQLQLLAMTWPAALFVVDGNDETAETRARRSVTEIVKRGDRRAAMVMTPRGTDPGSMNTRDLRRLAHDAALAAGLPPLQGGFF